MTNVSRLLAAALSLGTLLIVAQDAAAATSEDCKWQRSRLEHRYKALDTRLKTTNLTDTAKSNAQTALRNARSKMDSARFLKNSDPSVCKGICDFADSQLNKVENIISMASVNSKTARG